jgi:hypothetical protein
MIGYVTLGTNDIGRAAAFCDALLGPLGAGQWNPVVGLGPGRGVVARGGR